MELNKNKTEKRVIRIKGTTKHGKPLDRKVSEMKLQIVISNDDEVGEELRIFIGTDRKINIVNSLGERIY